MSWFQKNRVLVILVLLAAIISLAASFSSKSEIPVKAGKVERETIVNTISTNGKIEPAVNFQGRAAGPSLVRKVLVHEGDQVKAGQLLVQLDESEARAQAARAKAQLRSAESDLASMSKGGSQDEVITIQSNISKVQTDLDAAQRNLAALKRLKETGAASAGEAAISCCHCGLLRAHIDTHAPGRLERITDAVAAAIADAAPAGKQPAASAGNTTPPGLGKHAPASLPFKAASLRGISEKMITSHHDKNYTGAVKNLNKVEADLAALKADAIIDGEELARLASPYAVDNLEGLAATTGERGETLLWMIADDNFNPLQRNLLLLFELAK